MDGSRLKWIMLTQVMLLIYSTSGLWSKLAAGEEFLSFHFFLYYGISLLLLAGYALGWQQVIKHLPLTTAYANKAITIVWGIIWGALFFHEEVTVGKMIGGLIVMAGVILYARSECHE